ncbi:MAG: hypothetical protein ACRDE7_11365, partial [Sphingobacterium sp.]
QVFYWAACERSWVCYPVGKHYEKKMTQAAIQSFHGASTELAGLIKDNFKFLAAKKSIDES